MKNVWSNLVSFLLFLLTLFFCIAPFSSSNPLFMQLGMAAMGMVFLAAFINSVRPEHRFAGKTVAGLNIGAASLVGTALVLWLLRGL